MLISIESSVIITAIGSVVLLSAMRCGWAVYVRMKDRTGNELTFRTRRDEGD